MYSGVVGLEDTMEYRKLISFGKNSFVVSLPKAWVRQSKLKKGDLIYVEEAGQNLVLSNKEGAAPVEDRETVINVDGKSAALITREVNSAYISNSKTLTLKGKEVRSKIKQIQEIIQNLIALEIMEQTSDVIIAKDFLNMDKVSMDELIRKMDVVTRTMLRETGNIFNEDNYENINERDKDVNRLYFLIYRAVLYNLENPVKAMKNFKLNSIDLFKIHRVAFYIEGIADESRRTARYARLVKISPGDRKKVEQLLSTIMQLYMDTMKSIYNKDADLAYKLSETKIEFNKELEALEERNRSLDNFVQMTGRIKRMISHIHNLGRHSYTPL